MNFGIQVDPAFAEFLNGKRARLLEGLRNTMVFQTGALSRYIKETKLSGQVLRNITGNLRNAVFPSVETAGTQIIGRVSVDNSAPYGKYQEYGAHIPERVPVRARVLHWVSGGADVFAMRARAFDLRARPFMRPSLEERRAAILEALSTSIQGALRA
ncbi:MAG TPA: hypothetical protein VKY31_01475 [Terriglobia bacterium]|nr:hypothetical protein [Terriglobia bacterium]HZP34178.1 hypothetical protein [Candidatus Acidoferrales bacterium]